MTRWISAALCTLALVAVAFCLPVWSVRTKQAAEASVTTDGAVSVVSVVKKRKPAPAPKAAPLSAPAPAPKEDAIAQKSAEPTPVEEKAPEREPPPQDEASAPEDADAVPAEDADDPSADDGTLTDGADGADGADSADGAPANADGARDATPAPVAPMSEEAAKAAASYKSYALTRIAAKKTYPYAARSQGLQGKVRIQLTINADGSLASAAIVAPCEHSLLNDAALAAVSKAAPFKKMKAGMEPLTITFVMDFALE